MSIICSEGGFSKECLLGKHWDIPGIKAYFCPLRSLQLWACLPNLLICTTKIIILYFRVGRIAWKLVVGHLAQCLAQNKTFSLIYNFRNCLNFWPGVYNSLKNSYILGKYILYENSSRNSKYVVTRAFFLISEIVLFRGNLLRAKFYLLRANKMYQMSSPF
jgi:hypothetical protein